MAEARRVSTPPTNKMTVIDQGHDITRPSSSGSITRNIKKMPSEGLISLSPEPGKVKFESTPLVRPSSGGSRCDNRSGSAGHIERKLQVARKKENVQEKPRENSAGTRISMTQPSDSSVTKKMGALAIGNEVTGKKPIPPDDQENKSNDEILKRSDETDSDSTESESESEESDVETPGAITADGKPLAPVELKGDFLKSVMDEDFDKAKELCQKILLLEPDNATCIEFHAVIVEKMKQDEEDDEDSSEGDSDDSEEDDDEGEDEEEDEDEEEESSEESDENESSSDSDDDYTPPSGPINLIMGGLPIRPQPR